MSMRNPLHDRQGSMKHWFPATNWGIQALVRLTRKAGRLPGRGLAGALSWSGKQSLCWGLWLAPGEYTGSVQDLDVLEHIQKWELCHWEWSLHLVPVSYGTRDLIRSPLNSQGDLVLCSLCFGSSFDPQLPAGGCPVPLPHQADADSRPPCWPCCPELAAWGCSQGCRCIPNLSSWKDPPILVHFLKQQQKASRVWKCVQM